MWIVIDEFDNQRYGPDTLDECNAMYDTLGGYAKGWKVIRYYNDEEEGPWDSTF